MHSAPREHHEGSKMLVLTREEGEAFSVGEEVCIQVLAISGNQIRLGIDAPKHIKIHRAEVYKRIVDNYAQRAASPAADAEADSP
jgi:carbon storage regulator